MRTLYLCYFGLREALVQTQVLPYLRELSRNDIEVTLLTFEPGYPRSWPDEEKLVWRNSLQDDGIRWEILPYHKRPTLLATLYDTIAGALVAARMARRSQIDVMHARAQVPVAMALLAQKLGGGRIIFDFRGLVADEYVDAGIWKTNSLAYNAIKWIERTGIRKADQVVVLTKRMCDWLVEHLNTDPAKITVIPCCVDLSRFCKEEGIERNDSGKFEVVYAGSVTGLYLLDEMAAFFLSLRERRPGAYLRILTTSKADGVLKRLDQAGLKPEEFWVGAAEPSEISGYLKRARVGLSFRKPTFSQIAASPTKISEYLAAGLPVISNAGIGDTDRILLDDRVGVIVKSFDKHAYDRALDHLETLFDDPRLAERCRRSAYERFGLENMGGESYRNLYRRLSVPDAKDYSIAPSGL